MTRNIWAGVGVIVVVLVIIGAVIYSNQNPPLVSVVTPVDTYTQTSSNQTVTKTVTSPQPASPNVVTSSSVIPTDTTVVVSGTVTPNGVPTNYWFEYGTTSSLGSKTTTQLIGSGYLAIPSPGYITGLTKDTTYYFHLVAQNEFGKVIGSQFSFQTTHGVSIPTGSTPTVRTTTVSDVSRYGATLNGNVTPNRAATSYWFEYGTSKNFGFITSLQDVGNGTANVTASTQVSNLNLLTTYYYRLNAQNQFGTIVGSTFYFKTIGPAAPTSPSATTVSATNIKGATSTLRATVNPNGAQTQYWFEFSTDSQLATSLQTSAQTSAGAGVANVSVSAAATNLSTSTTYYFRVVTQNDLGTVRGNILSFKTKNN
jgi:phosphodiesterase/alkaline phosphatase D-like protein